MNDFNAKCAMREFDLRGMVDFAIVALISLIVFSFKWQLAGIGEGGIRVDDIAILILFLLVFSDFGWRDLAALSIRRYIYFIIYSLCISLYAGLAGKVNIVISLLFSLRPLEYLLFYFVGLAVYRRGLHKYIWIVLELYAIYLLVIIPLQMSGVIPVVSGFGATRAIGNTNGPYELAAISAGLCLFFMFTQRVALFWIMLMICIAAAARITSVCLLLIIVLHFRSFVVHQLRYWSASGRLVALVLFLVLAVPVAVSKINFQVDGDDAVSLWDRLQEIDPTEFYSQLSNGYASAIAYSSSAAYQNNAFEEAISVALGQDGVDVSGLIRAYRWATLLKSTFESPMNAIFGLGPSFGTAAVDGYYVRLLCETGIIGLIIFLYWLISVFRNPMFPVWLKGYLVVLAVTGAFIDIFVSFKPMLIMWLFVGMATASFGVTRKIR